MSDQTATHPCGQLREAVEIPGGGLVETPASYCYAVIVPERIDGLYLFTDRESAEKFREAVIDSSFSNVEAILSEEPISDPAQAEALIEAEVGS